MAHCTVMILGFLNPQFSGLQYECWVQPTGEETFSPYDSDGYYSIMDFPNMTPAQVNAQMIIDIKSQVFYDPLSNEAVLQDADIKVLTKCMPV